MADKKLRSTTNISWSTQSGVGCLILFLCFVPCASEAQDDASSWLEDAHGCKFFNPNPSRQAPPFRWDGACVDGYLSGAGTVDFGSIAFQGEFKRGLMDSGEVRYRSDTYKGALKGNLPNGRGTWTLSDGWVVEAEHVKGVPIGTVDITYPDGSRYRGEVKFMGLDDIQRHGQGRMVGANGNNYEGAFQFDQPHGKGTATYARGGSYSGDFAFGDYNGKGVFEEADGSRYEGDFVHGKTHGEGTFRYADGSVYVGQFVAGDAQGKGRRQYPDGTVYEGDWKGNELNGACTVKNADGTSFSGECIDGKRSGRGRFEDPANGEIYDGGYRNDRFHGQGRLQQPGYSYEGSFLAGVRSGRGKEVYESGEQYEGEFSQGLRHGHGLLRLPAFGSNEVTYEGEFKKGVIEGNGKLQIGPSTFTGEFTSGEFIRGRVSDSTGRITEVDVEAGTFLQVLPDGTKIPVDRTELHIPGI